MIQAFLFLFLLRSLQQVWVMRIIRDDADIAQPLYTDATAARRVLSQPCSYEFAGTRLQSAHRGSLHNA